MTLACMKQMIYFSCPVPNLFISNTASLRDTHTHFSISVKTLIDVRILVATYPNLHGELPDPKPSPEP